MPSYTPGFGKLANVHIEINGRAWIDLDTLSKQLIFDESIWFVNYFIWSFDCILFDNHFNIYKLNYSADYSPITPFDVTNKYVNIGYYRENIYWIKKNDTSYNFHRRNSMYKLSDELIVICKHIDDEKSFNAFAPVIYTKLLSS